MKSSKILTTFGLTATLVTAQIVALPNQKMKKVQAQTSGCGSGKSWYLTRVMTPVSAQQFGVACDEHDACYDTYGKSKQECDKAFHRRMLGICASDHNTILGKPLRIACNGRADAFYTAVLEYGQDSYKQAQDEARKKSQPSLIVYSLVCLTNKTNLTLNYQGKWSNETEWFNIKLEPYSSWRHWRENSSASFTVNFDTDLRQGQDNRKSYTLSTNSANDTQSSSGRGYWYDFSDSSKNFIDLYSTP
ncbi:hypothetical protein [Geminocystis sp. GBBB08]|uniref:hypothetical protein n=1 Tax=Geminocystis sp. GBBB08 TaxID=2604140 RepID=UPI0027E31D60|nr:hypothetical protein [Geminocystis sp. GBBB08]MBL1210426.1 hypothetical protein [Geminocystis sp. GBBB08]